jgi:hypothetical protein
LPDQEPTQGTLTLAFVRPSTDNPDRNDYHLSGTIEWDSQESLDCFAQGTIDHAYEHSITYGTHFDRKLWNVDLSDFPVDAGAYIDTTADDNFDPHTDLSFGIFRPETLTAGHAYSFSFDLFLPNNPSNGKQWILLAGQVLNYQCSRPGPWCVGLDSEVNGYTNDPPFIGWTRGFALQGTTCWAWHLGLSPTDCSPPTPQATSSSTPAPPPPPPPPPTTPPAPPTTPASIPSPTPPTTPQAPPTTSVGPKTAVGTVNGCNTYGQNCDGNPIYVNVPQPGYDWRTEPKITTVANGTQLTARCWARGGITYNWAVSLGDPGPNPYDSDIYYNVQAPSGLWGYIPDTYFVRDKVNKMGLSEC